MCNKASARLSAMRRGSDSVQTTGSREGGQIPETAAELSDIECTGLCLGHRMASVAGLSGERTSPVSSAARSTRRGAEFAQQLVRQHEERVLVEKPADDDQRMGAEDIHHDAGAEFGEVVRADDQVVVSGQEVIDPDFILHQILHPREFSQHHSMLAHTRACPKPSAFAHRAASPRAGSSSPLCRSVRPGGEHPPRPGSRPDRDAERQPG